MQNLLHPRVMYVRRAPGSVGEIALDRSSKLPACSAAASVPRAARCSPASRDLVGGDSFEADPVGLPGSAVRSAGSHGRTALSSSIGSLSVSAGSAEDVDDGHPLDEIGAAALRHAPQDADDEVGLVDLAEARCSPRARPGLSARRARARNRCCRGPRPPRRRGELVAHRAGVSTSRRASNRVRSSGSRRFQDRLCVDIGK